MILPRVKKQTAGNGLFKGTLSISEACAEKKNIIFIFECLCPDKKIEIRDKATMVFYERSDMRTGEYSLSVSSGGVSVSYGGYEGLRNAISSLSYLIKKDGIPCCDISDFPDNTYRACLIDLARGYVEMPVLREHIIRMAKLKYNILHLHLMDRQTYCLDSEVVPNPDGHRLYSKDDMRALVDFATRLGFEIVPEIEFPAHARNLLRAIPSLSCDIIDKRAAIEKVRAATDPYKLQFIDSERCVSAWTVCMGNDDTYLIYERIIKEVADLFPGKHFHIGGDEFEFLHIAAHPHWDNCRHCKKKMESEGYEGIRQLYYYGLRKLHKIITSLGKRMMMWNDQLDVWNPIEIPKDIIVYFWRSDMITKEKGVYQALLNQGFESVNAHYPYTYLDGPGEMDGKNIAEWTTKTEFLGEPELDGKILGGMLSAWSLGDPAYIHLKYTIPVGMALLSDRVWNNEKTVFDKEYREALFSAISGENDIFADPFAFFTDIIPPRSSKSKCFIEDVDLDAIDVATLDEAIKRITEAERGTLYGRLATEAVKKLLVNIRGALQ